MKSYVVTVFEPKHREPVMAELSEYGELEAVNALKRVFKAQVRDGEAFEAACESDPRVRGSVDANVEVKPSVMQKQFMREGRLSSDKIGALRLKATQDARTGFFNPWWQQPGLFEWRYDTGRLGAGVVIAVVDGGVLTGHPEFQKNPSRVKRIYSYDPEDQISTPHATAIAAIAAGDISGIAPEAEIWDSKCFPSDGGTAAVFFLVEAVAAVVEAANDPVENPEGKFVIANLSFVIGGNNQSNALTGMISDILDAGVIPIVAAGNDGYNLDGSWNVWPAEDTDYAVGSVHYDGRRAGISNYGSRVKFYGFGAGIMGAGYPEGKKYQEVDGTSFAAPYVCGCLATWLSGRWRPESRSQIVTLMTDYLAFCQEGIYGDSVVDPVKQEKVDGAVIARASYFPVLPGDVIAPQTNVVVKFGSAEFGTLGWKTRATPVVGGAGRAVTGQTTQLIAMFLGPYSFPLGGPWLDTGYIPAGWSISNDLIKGAASGDNMFVVSRVSLTGKRYWEMDMRAGSAGSSVGVVREANLADFDEGVTGLGEAGIEWFADGSLVADGVAQTSTVGFADGDRIMLAYDANTGDFWCGKNGTWAADPAANAPLASISPDPVRAAVSPAPNSKLQFYGETSHFQYFLANFFGLEAPDPNEIPDEIDWLLDMSRDWAGYDVYEDQKTLENNASVSGDYQRWMFTEKRILATDPEIYYWEIHVVLSYGSINGYAGLVTPENINYAETYTGNPIYFGSAGRRGNGSIWGGPYPGSSSDTSQQVNALRSVNSGDVIMLAFEPTTGKFWTGVSGVWDNDPSGPPTYTLPSGPPEWALSLQARSTYTTVKLVTSSEEFTYPVPDGLLSVATLRRGAPEGDAWTFDPDALLESGHALYDDDTRMEHVGLPYAKYRQILPTVKYLDPATTGRFYWEVQCADGPATWESHAGLVCDSFLAVHVPPAAQHPTTDGNYAWYAAGQLFGPTGSRTDAVNYPSWGAGDRLMFCAEPSTGSLWFGKNGTWHSDPASDPPIAVYPIEGLRPFGQVREGGASVKLISLQADFLYPVPNNCLSLASAP